MGGRIIFELISGEVMYLRGLENLGLVRLFCGHFIGAALTCFA